MTPAKSVKSRRRETLAIAERAVNLRAHRANEPVPCPNVWDELDLTKIPADASADELEASYDTFRRLCPPRPRKEHSL